MPDSHFDRVMMSRAATANDIDADLDMALAAETDPVKRYEIQMRVLIAHVRMMNDQSAERTVDRHLLEQRIQRMEGELKQTLAVTTEVRDVLDAVKAGLRVLAWLGHAVRWAGYLSAAAAAIYGLYMLVRHGGPKA